MPQKIELEEVRSSGLGRERLSVLTLNVLARSHAEDLHKHTASHVLAWPARRERLLKEITERNAAILCLQDVDDAVWWQKRLSAQCAYDTRFQERVRLQQRQSIEDMDEKTGVLIAWKRSHFQLLRSESILLQEAASLDPSMSAVAIARDDVAVWCLLAPFNESESRTAFCVTSFQCAGGGPRDALPVQSELGVKAPFRGEADLSRRALLEAEEARRKEEQLRFLQVKYMAAQLEVFNRDSQVPLVVCGTLNSVPGSDAYDFLCHGLPRFKPRPPQPPTKPPLIRPDSIATSAAGFFRSKTDDFQDSLKRKEISGYAVSPTSVLIQWEPSPQGESKVDRYWISWRAGGSGVLGWNDGIQIEEFDAICYKTELDPRTNRRKTVRGQNYMHRITNLISGISYEFRIAAENVTLGRGDWSTASPPYSTRPCAKIQSNRHYLPIEPPCLLLTEDEAARKRALGAISLSACLDLCRERAIEVAAPEDWHRSALGELRFLEILKSALDTAGVSPELIHSDPEIRRQARQRRGMDQATTFSNDVAVHPWSTRSGLTPRHNGAHSTTDACSSEQTLRLPALRDSTLKQCKPPPREPVLSAAIEAHLPKRLGRPSDWDPDPTILDDTPRPRDNYTKLPEHKLQLDSAYRAVFGKEPAYTATTEYGALPIDFIFFSRDTLEPAAISPMPLLSPVEDQFAQTYINNFEEAPNDEYTSALEDDEVSAGQDKEEVEKKFSEIESLVSSESDSETEIEEQDDAASRRRPSYATLDRPLLVRRASYYPNQEHGSDHLALQVEFGVKAEYLASQWA